jgi:hypothetical protein
VRISVSGDTEMSGSHRGRFRYLTSISEELRARSNRVRDLIGDRHWLSDGHHKEFILSTLLRCHLPSGILATRGFVVNPHDQNLCSKEQDILVVDCSREAPLFHDGGVVICFPRMVMASISVKTTLTRQTVADVIDGLNSVREAARDDLDPRRIWCGGFFFEIGDAAGKDATRVYDYIEAGLKNSSPSPPLIAADHPAPAGADLLCSASDYAFKIDHGSGIEADGSAGPRILGYSCGGTAASLFVADLLGHLAYLRGLDDSNFGDFAENPAIRPLGESSRRLGRTSD